MIDTGCALESLAMRSSEAATGTRTTTQACSISTTTGPTTTTTMSASADPTLQHLDAGHAAAEGSILVESIPQDTAKARHGLIKTDAKPKTAAEPTGAVVERGKNKSRMHTPYTHEAYRVYFAVIRELDIENECIEPDPFNKGGIRDTEKGAKLYRKIYEALA